MPFTINTLGCRDFESDFLCKHPVTPYLGMPCLVINYSLFAFEKIFIICVSHKLRHGVYREFPETILPMIPYRMG